ncbi:MULTISPECIES: hypothetical protein [Ruminococcus]|uniref:Uncharacterized protein n=1 Tax=Ruminococcus flavefaciens TaxID=1265 RepID=A0A1M7GIQ7_RUMFL|nr:MULTISPECIES: hypothetical protein [Ruminococcus]MCR4795942.1 hypothetical protein [Ruminococcus sp.]SHM15739.1 hypothetical protein SAMN04487860_101308 [Ruminococcus flavefaciens]
MKKILGILFLLIIVAAGVCAYFFPGIPYYYKCTHELEIRDSIWEELPKDLPKLSEGYADFSTMGVRITAWNDMEAQRAADDNAVTWANEDKSHMINISQERINESSDFLDMTGITHDDLDAYCKDAEKTTPESKYEFVKLMASLTMDDFDIHNYKNSKTFYRIMKLKSDDFYFGKEFPVKFYPVDGVGYRGYLLSSVEPDGDHGYAKFAVINIYPEKDKKTRYIIDISVTDWNEVLAIANSIKLT